jgi:hypothetical protein
MTTGLARDRRPATTSVILDAGIAIFALPVRTTSYFVGRYLLSGIGVDGYTSLIVSIWFFGAGAHR